MRRVLVVGMLALSCSAPPSAPPAAPSTAPAPAVVTVAAAEPAASPTPRPSAEPEKQLLKSGGEFTVQGLSHALQTHRQEHPEAAVREPIMVTGFIVATNLGDAPPCAV